MTNHEHEIEEIEIGHWIAQDKHYEIINLPSITPKPKVDDDCISRQVVLDIIEHYNSDALGSVFIDYEHGLKLVNAIKKIRPISQTRPKGHWIESKWGFECSECHKFIEGAYDDKTDGMIPNSNYCPNCGSRNIDQEEDIPIEYFENGGI